MAILTPSLHTAGTWVFSSNNVSASTTLSPTAPTRSVGNLLLLVTTSRSITAACATPTGYSLLSTFPKRSATASGGSIYVFSRYATNTSADSASAAWTGLTSGTSGDSVGAVIIAYTNAGVTVDVAPTGPTDTSGTGAVSVPTLTTTVDMDLVLGIAMKVQDAAQTWTEASPYSEDSDSGGTTSGTGHTSVVAHVVKTPAGVVAATNFTPSSATSGRLLATSFALEAAQSLTKTQSATANIIVPITKTQTATARIVNTITKTQSATANIFVAPVITVRNTATTVVSVANPSITTTLPTNSAGDLLIAAVQSADDSATAMSTPSGWTKIGERISTDTGGNEYLAVYSKISSGSETNPTFTLTGGTSANQFWSASVSSCYDAINGNPVSASLFNIIGDTTGPVLTTSSITPGGSGAVFSICSSDQNGAGPDIGTLTSSSGNVLTKLSDVNSGTAGFTYTATAIEQQTTAAAAAHTYNYVGGGTSARGATMAILELSAGAVLTNAQTAVARISVTGVTKTQSATARIAHSETFTQTAIARIAHSETFTQSAVARIKNTNETKTQSAVARVQIVGATKTQSAVARIAHGETKTQTAIARIAVVETKTQGAVARIVNTETKTQTAHAAVQNTATHTQSAVARIAHSETKTQTAIARIAHSETLTQTAVARIAHSETKTQSAVARIAVVETKTQSAIARIVNTETHTQSAVARIAHSETKTQSAVARIAKSFTLTQGAVARIAVVETKTQSAVARIVNTETKTQSAVARVQVTATQTQSAVANIVAAVSYPVIATTASDHDTSAHTSRSVTLPTGIAAGDLLLMIVGYQSNAGGGGTISTPTGWTLGQSGNVVNGIGSQVGSDAFFFRHADGTEGSSLTLTTANNGLAQWWVADITGGDVGTDPASARASDNNSGNATPTPPSLTPSWGSAANLWLACLGVSSTSVSGTPSGYTSVFADHTTGIDNWVAVSSLTAIATSESPGAWGSMSSDNGWGAFTIAVRPSTGSSIVTATQTAVARIQVTGTATQSAVARIQKSFTLTQSAVARIAHSETKTQSATARIVNTETKTQSATARIAHSETFTQSAVARIAHSETKTQTAVARIAHSETKTQTAIARIAVVETKTQTAVARVRNTLTKTQSATANISTAASQTKTQSATARIQKSLSTTQSAVARIAKVFSATQSAIARIAKSETKTQTAVARIAHSETKTQTTTARISILATKTQSAIARVQVTATHTQAATARIEIHRTAFNTSQFDPSTADSELDDNAKALTIDPGIDNALTNNPETQPFDPSTART